MDDRQDQWDDWRWQGVAEEWGVTADEQAKCSVCGEPVLFSQGRLRHSLPAMKRPAAPFGTDAYNVEEMRWGTLLGIWTLKTSDHSAAL